MSGAWTIKDFENGDEKGINALFNSVFNKSRSLDYWLWEFSQSPNGFKAFIATENQKIIGHLAAINRKIEIGGDEFSASLEVDGMTQPKFARQGIFIGLGKRLLSEYRKEGTDIVYGFPNENALPGHRKMNCIELSPLHVMIRPVNYQNISRKMFSNGLARFFSSFAQKLTFSLLRRPKKSRLVNGVNIITVEKFDDRFDDLWKESKNSHNIILKRDSTYLNWRYKNNPEIEYRIFSAEKEKKILAWIVVRTLDRFNLKNGAIVDILALPDQEENVHAMILKAVEFLKQKNVDLLAVSIPRSSLYYGLMKKCGFVNCPKSLNPKEEPFIIYPVSEHANKDYVKDSKNWFITWGDTDVV
jgi:hypothetical protein